MIAPLNQRSPRSKPRWLIPVVVLATVGTLLWDTRAPVLEPAARPPVPAVPAVPAVRAIAKPPSTLQLVGLPDNVDLEGLPAFFAVYANDAEWHDNRTKFAYWHPGAKAYAYFFEAIRGPDGFHFQVIPEPPVGEHDFYWDESLGDQAPIRFYRSYPVADAPTAPVPVPVIKLGNGRPMDKSTVKFDRPPPLPSPGVAIEPKPPDNTKSP